MLPCGVGGSIMKWDPTEKNSVSTWSDSQCLSLLASSAQLWENPAPCGSCIFMAEESCSRLKELGEVRRSHWAALPSSLLAAMEAPTEWIHMQMWSREKDGLNLAPFLCVPSPRSCAFGRTARRKTERDVLKKASSVGLFFDKNKYICVTKHTITRIWTVPTFEPELIGCQKQLPGQV